MGAEELEGFVDVGFDGAHRKAQLGGYLFVSQALNVAHAEHFAALVGEVGNGLLEELLQLTVFEQCVGDVDALMADLLVDVVEQIDACFGHFAMSQHVECAHANAAIKVGFDGSAGVVEVVALVPKVAKRVFHHILGFVCIAYKHQGITHQGLIKGLEQVAIPRLFVVYVITVH